MKSRARSIAVIALLLMLVTGVTVIGVRGRKPPVSAEDLRPVRIEVAANENSFPAMTRAGNRLSWVDEADAPQLAGMAECNVKWKWNQELAEQLLARNQSVLELLDEALPPSKLQVPTPSSVEDDYPYLSDWTKIALLTSIRSAVLDREGREREAFDLAFKLVQLGHRIEDSGGEVFHYRRGASIKMMGLSRIQQLAFKTSLPADYLTHLLRELGRYKANESALTNTIKVDYQLNAALVRNFSIGKFSGTNPPDPVLRAFGVPMLNVEKTERAFATPARIGLKCIPHSYAKMPLGEFPPAATNSSVAAVIGKIARGNASGETVFDLMYTSPKGLLAKKCEENVAVSATEGVLALKCHQAQHGALPESLADLVPDYLPAVPLDDFDGKPLRYSREKKLIYSVGWNLTDDGGQERNAQKERLDIVFPLEF